MNSPAPLSATRQALGPAIELACQRIAPNWPLDRQIAVNPFWGFIGQPFDAVAATLRRLLGSRLTLPPEDYLGAWQRGEITPAALRAALRERSRPATVDSAITALQVPRSTPRGLPLLSDTLDEDTHRNGGILWRETITQQVSQYCASYFDAHQADWHRAPHEGLYLGWRTALQTDHAIEPLMHAPQIRARARRLPATADEAIAASIEQLQVPADQVPELLQLCLLRINGWASWCAYLAWEAQLRGSKDLQLRELLAIRLAWEALLDDQQRDSGSTWSRWQAQWREAQPAALEALDLAWQRAHEISYQDGLIRQLAGAAPTASGADKPPRPAAQLVFCIDVRSERFRRALEAAEPRYETRGFAGFFGLPIRYTPLGTDGLRPQLPGLIAPSLDVTETTGDPARDQDLRAQRQRALRAQAALQPIQRTPSGAFSLVETLGLGYLGAILRRVRGAETAGLESLGLGAAERQALHPQLCGGGPERVTQQATLVESILKAMGLTHGFARLLVLVGHGSQSVNNPQAAALDCGACGGQTGEINARVLARLLNDPAIRAALTPRGIHIPSDTLVIAALHNTTTDEVELHDIELAGAHDAEDLATLQRALAEAGRRTRAERAPDLGLAHLAANDVALHKALRHRARDWAQTRPEWGLANNASFIIAPRARTRGMDLAGRAFLHDYHWTEDPQGKVLEQIMTAPMIVTHWINLQYLASTVDPDRFGSGNKLLHNVACGRIGVFEGNTGDLRIGLARQSLHDGQRWMHAPLRLSVMIEAPRHLIDAVLTQHATVRQLVSHQWLHLFRIDDRSVEQWRDGRWQAWSVAAQDTPAPQPQAPA